MVDIQTIKIPWCKPEIVGLRHLRVVVPPTPPDMSPGVEYLTDSPFSGVKMIDKDPDVQSFTIPLRNLSSTWTDKIQEELGYKPPSSTEWHNDLESSWEVVTTTPIATDPWPPEDADRGATSVSLDVLDSEGLFTDFWCLYVNSTEYPWSCTWYINRVGCDVSIVASEEGNKNGGTAIGYGVPRFYTGNPDSEGHYPSASTIICYEVQLYISVKQFYSVLNPTTGLVGWIDRALAPYDARDAFTDKVDTSDSVFFRRFRECMTANPGLASVYTKLMGMSPEYWGNEAGLLFYLDYIPEPTP